jgi:hypothetical protein
MSRKSSARTTIEDGSPADQRAYFRWAFPGTAFPCRMGKKNFEIRLKDLSRGGACGLIDEPFAIGDFFFIQLDEQHVVEAEVRWVRLVMIGVKFGNVLSARFVTRQHEKACEEAAQRKRDEASALLAKAR